MSVHVPLDRWPRNMRRSTAAAYLDMSAAEFDRQVAIGALPLAFRLGKYEYWSRARIDEHVALLAGEAPAEPDATDWRKELPLYAAR